MKLATIGTVISRTVLSEDLIPALHDELGYQINRQDRTPENRGQLDKLIAIHGNIWDGCWDESGEFVETENDWEIVEELFNALDVFAPPYCYFGAHAGDGSDYGYWPCMESIDELPRYSDLSEVPDDIAEDFAIVNDHGNLTVYSSDGVEIIGIV